MDRESTGESLLLKCHMRYHRIVSQSQILKPMHTTSTDTVDDMITMFELEEFTILRNLYMRYKEKKIYVSLLLSIALSK